jgi:hypothetical protein
VFGEPALMRRLVADAARLDPITVCGQPRLVNARTGTYQKTPWPDTAARLRDALVPYGLPLAEMVECTP